MAFFDSLMTSLKQKWLQFFSVNRSWLTRHMELESVKTPDGGRRPPSYLILGVINALEPQLTELMLPFSKLNPSVDALIDALELNFDPDLMLSNGFNSTANTQLSDPEVTPMPQAPIYDVVTLVETSNLVEPDQISNRSFGDIEEVVVVESDDQSIMVLGLTDLDDPSDMSSFNDTTEDVMVLEEPAQDSTGVMNVSELDELNDMLRDDTDSESLELSPTEADMFGDMSLDEMADIKMDSDDDLNKLDVQSDESENELHLWGEETQADSADDETHSKENKQSEEDREISRLFPNF